MTTLIIILVLAVSLGFCLGFGFAEYHRMRTYAAIKKGDGKPYMKKVGGFQLGPTQSDADLPAAFAVISPSRTAARSLADIEDTSPLESPAIKQN